MEYFKDDLQWNTKAKLPLRAIIVGAGIGGLTAGIGLKQAGHDVVILEQTRRISEFGAGIQMAPNATRILGRLGLLDKMIEKATILKETSIRRYADNRELGLAPLMPKIGIEYHAPLCAIHRGDLQHILLQGAREEGIDVRTGCKVVQADKKFEARVKLESGEWISGDVVIAADGIKSDLRRQIAQAYGVRDRTHPTGDAAYRVLIPKGKMEHDPNALRLLEQDVGVRWMGPGGHVMAYPIKNNTVYNMVLLHPHKPDSENTESWTHHGDKGEMLDFYSKWNSQVKELLTYVPEGEVMEWTLNSHDPLPSWTENKVALLGDACHPMLPYVAQGAAQAIEDAGVLSIALTLTSDILLALAVYSEVRKSRGEAIQQSASRTRHTLHLPDGPEQEKRDAVIGGAAQMGGKSPDLWVDRSWQDFMYRVDVMKEVIEGWDGLVAKVKDHRLAV